MKYSIKSFILGFVVCLTVIGVVVYAAAILAVDVDFIPKDTSWNVDNVEDAINDLKNKSGIYSGVYGVRRKLDSTSSTWERVGESVGKVANAQVGESSVRNDFDNIYPWSDIKSYNYNTDTGKIIAWYGDNNFSFKPEGNIEVLTYIPEFYYLRVQANGYEYVLISKDEKEFFTKSDVFSIGRYMMSWDSNRVHSKSDTDVLTNINITAFRGYAQNLGNDFGILDYHYLILQLLYLVEYADYNSQSKLGSGVTNGSGPVKNGECDALEMHSGSANSTNNSPIIYRGIENIYGNLWQYVDGINIKDRVAYISYDPSKYKVDTFGEVDGYHKLGYVNAASDNYAVKLGYDAENQLVSFPITSGGIDSSYINDFYNQGTGNRIPLVGGAYPHNTQAGLWYWYLSAVSNNAASGNTTRLIRYN